ncbi:DNA replication ATP-dependent helicase/nuclease DNA2 [Pichia kudriavzevii]|uniref:DNA replication ATP-dependent helicase/nuclease n=1 Tax=Pichia kudriavzevii TaxID=4909 RepID=A0A1V2LMB9_PICKU|nr:DNA replication ATP-dependent helicase/nuclease DNA2 [Pichia kudriavzevii]
MDDSYGHPTKKAKIDSAAGPKKRLPGKSLDYSMELNENTNSPNTHIPNPKNKRRGAPQILNTIEEIDLGRRKKAISISDLNTMKKQSKKAGVQTRYDSVIELRDESDVSINSSSPLKLLRSSQDFNFESPKAGKPESLQRKSGSDDNGIYWETTPQSANGPTDATFKNDETITNELKLPSSPLRNVAKRNQSTDLVDSLVDPEVKSLMEKYRGNERLKIRPQPYKRYKSVESNEKSDTQVPEKKLCIKSKNDLIKETHNDQIDFSDMLAQIGSKLMTSGYLKVDESENKESLHEEITTSSNTHVLPGVSHEDVLGTTSAHTDCSSSDAFSDEIDVSEVFAQATQVPATQPPIGNIDKMSSDDPFSDDDEDLMDKIELGLTQRPVEGCRPITDQTEVEVFETDSSKLMKDMGACLLHRCTEKEFVENIIEKELEVNILDIFAARKSKQDIKEIIEEHFLYIREWIDEYMGNGCKHPPLGGYRPKPEYKATNILDIEENIMSPIFGIRGLIDVVIEAQLKDGRKIVVPLEIKTGREYSSNRAQASLYTLLVKQKYNVNSFYASLAYTKIHQCYLISVSRNDYIGLVNIRNQLSKYLVYAVTQLPPIESDAPCERCYSKEPCFILNQLAENGILPENNNIDKAQYDIVTLGLDNERYRSFYHHWDKLITKEEGLVNFSKTDLWKKSSQFRETNGGNCVGNLSVAGCEYNYANGQYVYIFERDPTIYPAIVSSHLARNDRVILSDDQANFAIANGYVKHISADAIAIVTNRNWAHSALRLPGFNKEANQTFKSVLVPKGTEHFVELPESVKARTYRLDKDQIAQGMSLARFNLLNLFLPDGDIRTRELLIENDSPKFSNIPQFDYSAIKETLNADQLKAVDAVSKINDYCLILGMPGTGKTTVISSLIDCIVKSGYSVLISAYTHSAVDNICEKLIKNSRNRGEPLNMLRTGVLSKIRPLVQQYCIYSENYRHEIKNSDEFQKTIDQCPIVATTCLGISDIVFGMGKKFDYCIIDEASQVTLPIVLGPIAMADKFVLVGDHFQLPPLVLHPEAKAEGLDLSLFQILNDSHPENVIELTNQYRMCADIMSLSNELIYDGRLKCGSEVVAAQKLIIPNITELPIAGTYVERLLEPERRVIFVNEDEVPTIHEISSNDKIENPGEAKVINTLIKTMLAGGINQEDIGVMSFYKAQMRHFFTALSKFKDLEILTADRFQGRDKDVIIISLVRTEVIGELLKEWRRVNVAITRARCKLIIFGSKKLLDGFEQFEGFMEMIENNGWSYNLTKEDVQGISMLDHKLDVILTSIYGTQNESSTHAFADESQQNSVRRLDLSSRAIRRTKILKYVIDSL